MRVLAAGAVTLALLVGGCTDASEEPAPAAPGASTEPAAGGTVDEGKSRVQARVRAVPPAPMLGACYRLSLTLATRPTNSSRAVPCQESHTAQTIHVGRLDLTPAGPRLRVDSPAVQRQPASVCPVRLRQYVGGTTDVRRRSRFEVVWFTPTLDQGDRGARWFRCDAVAVADDERLLPLPPGPRLRGVLDRPGTLMTYGLCGTAPPGTPGFHRVACALPHRWTAISSIDLPGSARYPGTARVRTAGDETCADQVQDRGEPALEFSYGWEWPTREQWAAGQHHGYCWAPSEP